MKKIIISFTLLLFVNAVVMAKDMPYITNIPYRENKKEIKLNKIDTNNFKNDLVEIEKNKFEFNYIQKMGYGYEYILTNNTDKDIILKGVNSNEFYNEDLSNESNKPLKNLARASFTSGQIYIPIYGLYYSVKCDLEKNSFIRDFPENKTIKAGEKIRILASSTKEFENPQADFILLINGKEEKIAF
ncbi:MAG: hypothetical protein II306_06475 [Clostridia bacterium]|nr:hypothetical protein [Clostridia bacterium]